MTFYQLQTSLIIIIIALALFGIGAGLMFGPTVSMGISALPRSYSGVAAGTVTTFQEIGGSMGLALIGTLFRAKDQSALIEKPTSSSS